MYACMYVRIYVCLCVYVSSMYYIQNTAVLLDACVCVRACFTRFCVCICTYMYVYFYIYIYIYM